MEVYKAISKVQEELAKHGIGKNQTNSFDKYKFRGIDDIYNALSPILAKHGLCILPRIMSRDCQERASADGKKAMFYVTVEAEFDFVSSEDGSKHTVKTYGEAMDRSDKATNKAMSAAYKYAAFQAFCIPTEGDDADAETPQVQPQAPAERITEDQAKRLREGLFMASISEADFCKRVRLNKVEDLEAERFDGAMKFVQQKAQQGEEHATQ